MRLSVRFLLVPLVAAPALVFAAGSAVVKQSADVRSAPSATASQVTEAPPAEPIEILSRKGAWYEVKSPSGWRGWMRMAAVKLTGTAQKKSSTSVSEVFEPRGVIGVRGLDEAALAKAQPDYAALERLRQYRATPQDAQRFSAELARTRGQP